jgi:hypothetical protein
MASWQCASVAAVADEEESIDMATAAVAAGSECFTISTAMASPSQPRMGSRAIISASSRVRMGG